MDICLPLPQLPAQALDQGQDPAGRAQRRDGPMRSRLPSEMRCPKRCARRSPPRPDQRVPATLDAWSKTREQHPRRLLRSDSLQDKQEPVRDRAELPRKTPLLRQQSNDRCSSQQGCRRYTCEDNGCRETQANWPARDQQRHCTVPYLEYQRRRPISIVSMP